MGTAIKLITKTRKESW